MIDSFTGKHKFLSNFSGSIIEYEGMTYPAVEHAFQAAKSLNPADRRRVLEELTPGRAKKVGRRPPLRPDWERVKVGIMRDLLREKFKNEYLAEQLLATGDQKLVKGNTWGDAFWGKCNGQGKNMLGKLLMEVRGELRKKA